MADDDKEFAAEVTEEALEQLLVKKGEDIDYRGSSLLILLYYFQAQS